MSQFDFPRLNFTGQFIINVGTGNNDDWSAQGNDPGPGETLPANPPFNANPFRLSDSVNVQPVTYGMDDDAFSQWAVSVQPATQSNGQAITQIPGEWNYFGDMSITFSNVNVCGVTLGYNNTVTDPKQNPLIGANISFNNDYGRTTAFICDVNPEDVPASQVFADVFAIRQNNTNLLSGKPTKAVTRWINFARNYVLRTKFYPTSAMASAIMQSAVPVSDFNQPGIQSLLSGMGIDPGNLPPGLQGFIVRYCFYRVIPQQVSLVQYTDHATWVQKLAEMYQLGYPQCLNPGVGMVSGTVGLWFGDEMTSITMGRYIVPQNPIPTYSMPLAPIIAEVNTDQQIISLDVSNTFPESYQDSDNNPKIDFGPVFLGLQINGTPYLIGEIAYDTQTYLTQGGMVDISYASLPSNIQELIPTTPLVVYMVNNNQNLILMQESQYMIGSDQALIYAEQGDTSGYYRTNGPDPIPCMLQVYQYGAPLPTDQQIATMFAYYSSTPNFNQPSLGSGGFPLSNNYQLTFDTSSPGTKMCLVVPNPADNNPPGYNDINLGTAFYVNLRVLPKDDFSQYLGTGTPIPWSFLYDNVLRYYNLIFPGMAQHVPFVEAVWTDMAAVIYERVDVSNWANTSYMPRSRDLSETRRQLIQAWCKQYMP